MTNIEKPIAVLDANVLYPVPLCDFLLRLARIGLFIPQWSDLICDEWIRNLLANRPDLEAAQLERRQQAMNDTFPNANVMGFKNLIDNLNLPDKNDRHVLAAAIKSEANAIITFNKRDFPLKYVRQYNIEIESPDDFICQLLKINFPTVLQALINQVNALKNPPKSIEQVLNSLKTSGLTKSTAIIKDALKAATKKS